MIIPPGLDRFKPFEFAVDIEGRTARVSIPGVLESTGRPIISPATGDEHRVAPVHGPRTQSAHDAECEPAVSSIALLDETMFEAPFSHDFG